MNIKDLPPVPDSRSLDDMEELLICTPGDPGVREGRMSILRAARAYKVLALALYEAVIPSTDEGPSTTPGRCGH